MAKGKGSGLDLTAVKGYMRVEHDEDDAIIETMYRGAMEYLTEAGIRRTPRNDNRYDLAAWGLTLNSYDRRNADAPGTAVNPPFGLRLLINQLKMGG